MKIKCADKQIHVFKLNLKFKQIKMLTVHFQFSIFAHNGKTCFNSTVWYTNKMEIWLDTMFTDRDGPYQQYDSKQ